MRVRLSYSVELHEVPQKISDLIAEEQENLSFLNYDFESIINRLDEEDLNLPSILKSLDEARKALGAVDTRIIECQSILEGYQNTQNSSSEENETQPILDSLRNEKEQEE